MICLSPNATEVFVAPGGKFKLFTDVLLDGYKTDYSSIEVVEDPVFDQLPDSGLVVKNSDLILKVFGEI